MSQYLHVVSGPIHFLLNARGVREVLVDDGESSRAAYYCWRHHTLRAVSSRRLLALAAPDADTEHTGIVYHAAPRPPPNADDGSEPPPPIVLWVDGLRRLVRIADADFAPLPPVSPRLAELFDAVHAGGEGGELALRYRYPMPTDRAETDTL